MNRWQIIRIVFALCGIFAAGVVTGRFTAPGPAAVPVAGTGMDGSKGGPVLLDTGNGMVVNSAQVIRFFSRELNLTAKQRTEVIPMIRRGMADMQKTETGSPERLKRLRAMISEIRAQMAGPQIKLLDDIAESMEKEWIRRHPSTPAEGQPK